MVFTTAACPRSTRSPIFIRETTFRTNVFPRRPSQGDSISYNLSQCSSAGFAGIQYKSHLKIQLN